MRCAAECAIGGNAVGKECERGFNDELALWTRIKHIWCDEQLKPAEAATSSEVADRSTRCALLHKCGECCGCITRRECAACNAQRIGELWVSITQWLWLWQLDERRERKWEACSNSGAQRGDARAEHCCKERFGIEARCWAPRRLKVCCCFT
jgi:hypothetical protein